MKKRQLSTAIILFTTLSSFANNNEVIIVKGNKEAKTLRESNESIAILKKSDIASPLKEDNLEAINAVANVTVNKEDETFTIRGVKNTGVTGYQKDNLSSIISDQIFQTDLAIKSGSFNLWDISHIEIYRGAQSTTQGINSLAGSLNIYHQEPELENANKLKLEIGNYNKRQFNFLNNSVIFNDQLAIKTSGTVLNTDGHIKNLTTNNNRWGKKENYNLNIDALYLINDRDQIRFINKYFQSIHGGNYVHGPDPKRYEVQENLDSIYRTKNVQSGLEYVKEINDNLSNQLNFSYSNSKQITSSDSDLTAQNKTGVRVDKHRDNFTSLENLLKYQDNKFKNVLGLHLHRFSLIDNYDFNILPITNNVVNLNIKQYVDRKRETYAFFDSAHLSLSDVHHLNFGLRYEYVKNSYTTNVSGSRLGTSGNAGTDTYLDNYVRDRSGAYGGEKGSGKVLPKLGYLYHFDFINRDGVQKNPRQTLGISFVEGYRTGGVSINRYRTTAVNYNPESTYNYELSYKAQFSNTNVNSNLFYTNWRKQQVQVSLSSDTYDTQVTNASRSEFFGTELEVQHQLSDNQKALFNMGFVQSKFLSFIQNNKNYTGKEFPNAPQWTLMANHGWTFLSKFTLKTTFRYLGKSFADAENLKTVPEQFYTDLGLSYVNLNLEIDLSLKNIFNNQYLINRFTNSYGTYYQMSAPREIASSISYSW